MGRVGATAITCPHRCRWFCFCFVLFDCCVSLLLPSFHDDAREFLVTFGKGERGRVLFYIPLISSLRIVDSAYASQHCIAFVLGATQTTTKISLVAKKFVHQTQYRGNIQRISSPRILRGSHFQNRRSQKKIKSRSSF